MAILQQGLNSANSVWKKSPFLSRVSILTRDIDIANLSVRPSVRYVPVLYENDLTYCHSFSPYGSPIIPVLPASNIFTKFQRGHPPVGTQNTRGVQKFGNFWLITRYILQIIQDSAIVTMESE